MQIRVHKSIFEDTLRQEILPFAKGDPTDLLFNREQSILSSEGKRLHISAETPLLSKAPDGLLQMDANQMMEEAVSKQWLYLLSINWPADMGAPLVIRCIESEYDHRRFRRFRRLRDLLFRETLGQ